MLRPWELNVHLDANGQKPVYLQIADAIIADIQSGRLKKGTALPGSRKLALDLKVNRNTVIEALNVLLNEGWLIAKNRKGTFVADVLPVLRPVKEEAIAHQVVTESGVIPGIVIDDGHPDSKIAPIDELARAYRQIFRRKARWKMMGYTGQTGDPEFRKAISNMLSHQRGLKISENNVCITRGSQMAMYLAAHVLLEKGDAIIVENPGYKPAWEVFESAGAKLLPVGVDEEGLSIEEVKQHLKKRKKIKAIYTTPHHQYPTTVTLSLQRRLELIQLSNQYGFTVIEDDYDNEFHFGCRPVLPLASFQDLKSYVYIGTLSKVVAPSLRTGYLVSSDDIVQKAGNMRKLIDVQGDNIMEQAILELINTGSVRRHLRRANVFYKLKRDYFTGLLDKYLSSEVSYTIPEGGLAVWLKLRNPLDFAWLETQLQEKGISLNVPGSFYYNNHGIQGFRFGYASLSEQKLHEAVETIAGVLSRRPR